MADNARGVNATQLNLAGTGIGTFNDRLRDAVRGGGPFDGGDSLVANQGFINGLWYDPNALNDGSDDEKAKLLLYGDQIRVGLAGNLADYEFQDRTGNMVKGSQVDYNGSPAGYTQDPQENIIYVEAHDNQTLYDNNAYKLPLSTSMADRVRAQNLGLDFTLLAQGVPFLHAGEEILRSKSMDRNSLQLRRLVQQAGLDAPEQQLRRRPAACGRQRGELAADPAAPGQPGAQAGGRRHPGQLHPCPRTAEDSQQLAALPAADGRRHHGPSPVPQHRS